MRRTRTMTIIDLTTALTTAFPKIPVFYNHIIVEDGDELNPPWIVTNHEDINPFFADNKTYWLGTRNTVTQYVAKLTETNLKRLDRFFDQNEIPFQKEINFDEMEMLYSIQYTVQLDDLEVSDDGDDNGS